MNIFLANSRDQNWDLCVKHSVFGIKKNNRKLPDIKYGDLILMRISDSKENGVKAIWLFEKAISVNPSVEVPWKDAEYSWIIKGKPIITFSKIFNEEFQGYGNYSLKIPNFPSSRIQPSLILLKNEEYKAYFKHLLKEFHDELLPNATKDELINLDRLFSEVVKGKPLNYALKNSKEINQQEAVSVKEGPSANYQSINSIVASDTQESKDETIRFLTQINRIIRDTKLSMNVKLQHNYQCQLCGISIDAENGRKYAEAHHIKPLGEPHNGPDILQNIICVCPNCHAKLDYGIIKLELKNIIMLGSHNINSEFINYHNLNIYNKILR